MKEKEKDNKYTSPADEKPAQEENDAGAAAEETSEADDVKEQEQALASLKQQLAEEKDRYLRMAAEYDNYRRRSAKEREGAYTDAYADALMQIVPVIDNLERAAGFGESDPKQLADGVNMILSQFGEVLKKMGIETFGAEGETFDPMLHNAIMHEEDEACGENIIAAVFQKGYRRGDKLIRPAMVKVVN